MPRIETILGCAAAATLVGGTLIYALSKAHPDFGVGVDDANITFVYARNIAEGRGFVFNVGGERVEGSTSLLWTLVCALIHRLGGAEDAVGWAGIACFAAVQATFACLLASFPRGPDPSPPGETALPDEIAAPGKAAAGDGEALDFLLYFALVFSNPGYLAWNTLTLMDVTLWGAAVAFAAWFVARPPRGAAGFALAAAVWGAMCLTRPDALLVAPAFAVLAGWNAGRSGWRRGVLVAGVLLAAAVAALGGLTLFRLWYFGYPLPNTYYAKVAPGVWRNFRAGLDYDLGWIASSPIKAAAVAVALVAALRAAASAFAALRWTSGDAARVPPVEEPAPSADDGRRSVPALAAAFLVLLAVPCVTGGDHFHDHRFLQPAYPLGCLLLAAWARRERVLSKLEALLRSSGTAAAGTAVLAGIILVPPFLHERNWWTYRGGGPLKGDFDLAKDGRVRTAAIAAMFASPASEGDSAAPRSSQEKLPSMGLLAAGGTGYAYPGEKIDLLGLNSVAMGHSKSDRLGVVKNHSAFDADVFYQIHPEMIDCTESILVEADVFTRGLLRTPRFHEEYAYGRLRRLDPPGGAATLFIRRDVLKKLLAADGAPNGHGVRFAFEPIDLDLDSR